MYTLAPQPARFLVGKTVLNNQDSVDCQQEFEPSGKTIQITAGRRFCGAYQPESGQVYLVSQPKPLHLLAVVAKAGVRVLAPVGESYTLAVKSIGVNKDPSAAVEAAAELMNE